MKKISMVISLIGLLLLFIIYSSSNIELIDANTIDETMIGDTVKTKVRISSVKEFNNSIIVYPKEYDFRIYINQKINLSGLIEFTGIIDEDEYGLIIRANTIKEYKQD